MSLHHSELVVDIDIFREANSGMSETTFGRLALNDPGFLKALRKGRRIWPETEAKVRDFMQQFSSAATGTNMTPDRDEQRIVVCGTCDRRCDDPAVRGCTQMDCPHAEREAA